MTFVTNIICLGLGLGAGALLASPRNAVSELRSRMARLETDRSSDHGRYSVLRDRMSAAEDSLESLQEIHAGVVSDVLHLGSEVNSRLDALESRATQSDQPESVERLAFLEGLAKGLTDRCESLAAQSEELKALLEKQSKQVAAVQAAQQQQQQLLAERLQAVQVALPAPVAAPLPAPSTPAPPWNPGQGVGGDLAQLVALQRQAQQAFAMRQQQRQPLPQPGGDGVGL